MVVVGWAGRSRRRMFVCVVGSLFLLELGFGRRNLM